jgi:hypothetical protein
MGGQETESLLTPHTIRITLKESCVHNQQELNYGKIVKNYSPLRLVIFVQSLGVFGFEIVPWCNRTFSLMRPCKTCFLNITLSVSLICNILVCCFWTF